MSMSASRRWARFQTPDGRVGFGTVGAEGVAEHEGDMFSSPRSTGTTLKAGEYKLIAPCVPSKMVALWNNFGALAAKLGKQAPSHPLFLLKPATSILGPDEPIRRPTGYEGKIGYEGELGIVIGRRCSSVTLEEADSYIFGYTCVNDVTATDILNETAGFRTMVPFKGF